METKTIEEKRYDIMVKVLGLSLSFLKQFVSRKYFEGFNKLIYYISRNGMEYGPIKVVATSLEKSLNRLNRY